MSAKKTNKRTIWKFTFYILSFVIMPTTHETRTEVTCQGASYSCKAHPKKSQPQAVQRLCPQPPRAKLQERRGRQSGFGESATTVLGVVGEHDGRSPGPTTPGIKPGHRTQDTRNGWLLTLHWLQTNGGLKATWTEGRRARIPVGVPVRNPLLRFEATPGLPQDTSVSLSLTSTTHS